MVAGDHVVVGLPGLADALVLGGLLLIVGAAVARDQAPGTVPDIDPGPSARRGPGVVHADVPRGRIVPAIVEFDSGPAVVCAVVAATGVPLVAVIPQAADAAPGVAGENIGADRDLPDRRAEEQAIPFVIPGDIAREDGAGQPGAGVGPVPTAAMRLAADHLDVRTALHTDAVAGPAGHQHIADAGARTVHQVDGRKGEVARCFGRLVGQVAFDLQVLDGERRLAVGGDGREKVHRYRAAVQPVVAAGRVVQSDVPRPNAFHDRVGDVPAHLLAVAQGDGAADFEAGSRADLDLRGPGWAVGRQRAHGAWFLAEHGGGAAAAKRDPASQDQALLQRVDARRNRDHAACPKPCPATALQETATLRDHCGSAAPPAALFGRPPLHFRVRLLVFPKRDSLPSPRHFSAAASNGDEHLPRATTDPRHRRKQ